MLYASRFVPVLLFAAAIAGTAHAQAESRKLLEMTFKTPQAFDQFKTWAADTKNLRSAFIDAQVAWSDAANEWLMANVQNAPVVEDGDWRIVYIQSGGLAPETARHYTELVASGYQRMLDRLAQEQAIAERAKQEDMRDQTRRDIDELKMNLDRMPHGGEMEKLQESLAESNAALLETNLKMAELQAQLDTIRQELLAESQANDDNYVDGHPSMDPALRILSEQLAAAEDQVEQARKLAETGWLPQSEMASLEEKVLSVKHQIANADLHSKLSSSNPLHLKLREMLVDSETQFAGVSARSAALKDHIAKQEVVLQEAQQLHHNIQQAEHQREDLDRTLNTPPPRPTRSVMLPSQPQDEMAWVWIE